MTDECNIREMKVYSESHLTEHAYNTFLDDCTDITFLYLPFSFMSFELVD